jgi:HK97 family phage portal protein
MATVTLEVYKEQKSGTKEVAWDHPLQPLLDREPNPEMSDRTWRHLIQTHLCTYGNSYNWIQRNVSGNKVLGLWPRSPKYERTHPQRNKQTGEIEYAIRDESGHDEPPIPAKDMLHIPYLSMDGILGKSPIKLIREAIGGNKAAERFANELFKNGDVSQGYFTHPGKLSEPAFARLKKSLGENSDHDNRHRKGILEEGMTFEGTSYNVEQLQLIPVRQFLLLEVARTFRITPHLLQSLEGANFSTVTELGRQFVIYTLLPWCGRWCSEFNRKLLTPPYYVRVNFNAFLQGDPQSMAELHRTYFGFGAQSINEIRHEAGMNPLTDANADEHFVPMNMVPLSKAGDIMNKPNPAGGNPIDDAKPGMPPIGDGVTPADPLKQSKDDRAEQLAKGILEETFTRLARIASNEAIRAAKEPRTFLNKLDTFWEKHIPTAREAFAKPCELCGIELDDFLAKYIERTKNSLLLASECRPAELGERVEQTIKGWNYDTCA